MQIFCNSLTVEVNRGLVGAKAASLAIIIAQCWPLHTNYHHHPRISSYALLLGVRFMIKQIIVMKTKVDVKTIVKAHILI